MDSSLPFPLLEFLPSYSYMPDIELPRGRNETVSPIFSFAM
jgi:hypothetical protein